MQAVSSVGKHASSVKRGKIRNECRAWENTQGVSSAGNHASSVKRGKTCKQCQAWENRKAVSSAGKHAMSVKRGKTCNECKAHENRKAVSSAGKHAMSRPSYKNQDFFRDFQNFTGLFENYRIFGDLEGFLEFLVNICKVFLFICYKKSLKLGNVSSQANLKPLFAMF